MSKLHAKSERNKAWAQAKAAVRAYARDPSNSNAEVVRAAWEAVQRLDTLSTRRDSTPAGRRGSASAPAKRDPRADVQ